MGGGEGKCTMGYKKKGGNMSNDTNTRFFAEELGSRRRKKINWSCFEGLGEW
jgi:hypothetical protein